MATFISVSKQKMTNCRGFTVGEVLVVTAIFGILAVISVPQFLAFQPSLRLNGAARQVFSELMSARMKAVNENTTYTVTFPNNHTIQIAGSATRTVDLQTLYSDDVTLTSTQSVIQFSSRGTTDGAPTITITNSAGSKIVTVKITGAVTIS